MSGKRLRKYVYRYLVTSSEHPDIKVGTPLVHHRREVVTAWDFLTEAGVRTVVGRRGPRCCSECHQLGLVREYAHDGDHGQSAPYVEWPTEADIAEVLADA